MIVAGSLLDRTGPGGRDDYKARPVGSETWGTGAYLMAGSEIDRLR